MIEIQKWGIPVLVSTIFILLPRLAPGLLALIGVYSCIRFPPPREDLRRLLFWTGLVAIYPISSSIWALDIRRALTVVGSSALVAMVAVLVFQRAGRLKAAIWPGIVYGVPLVVFVSLIDILLGIPIRTFLAEMGVVWVGQPATVGKSGSVTPHAVNWSMAIMVLLLFPYLNATREASNVPSRRSAFRTAVVVAIFSAAFLSPHESSKVALCAGAAVYVIARLSKRLALTLVLAGWLASIAATPMAMSLALPLMQETKDRVQQSLADRFLIWRVALNDIEAHPWKGSGAGSTRITFREKAMNKKNTHITGIAAHSHNWFLDLWRELGAIGAALSVIWVALVARRLFVLLPGVPPELIAFTGLVLAMSTASFGLWELWYLSAIGLSFAMFGLTMASQLPFDTLRKPPDA